MTTSASNVQPSRSWQLGTNGNAVTRSGRARKLAPWIAGALIILLMLAALLIGWTVQRSLESTTRHLLQSVLSSNVTAVDSWIQMQTSMADQLTSDRELIDEAAGLLSRFRSSALDTDALSTGEAAQSFRQRLMNNVASYYLGWSLINTKGSVVVSTSPQLVGRRFDLSRNMRQRLDRGRTVLCPPTRLPVAIKESGHLSHDHAAIMFISVPIAQETLATGYLLLFIDPLAEFSQIMTQSQIGETGETFAFDRSGRLISESRFEYQLRKSGALAEDQRSPLNVMLVAPSTEQSAAAHAGVKSLTLTAMADQATRGGSGVNVDGYPSYLDEEVVGSWRWLREHDFGVATEMQSAEAFAAFGMVRSVLVGSTIVIALAGLSVYFLLRRNSGLEKVSNQLKRRLGQYQLGKKIGRGGMGSVYHGRHQLLKRDVAIKVLEHTEATRQSLMRFEREVQMSAKLRHPNTIEIYDFGHTSEGTFFYVMEYVAGISLQQLVDHYGRQPPERVIFLLLQVCGSIAEAHIESMVHRDIKPANILLTARAGLYDLVKVLDFGLVKEIDRETMQLTRTESMTGTPLYMSPEVIRDASKASRRSDLYSIGAVGYTLLTGTPPFDGPSGADICAKQLNEDPQRPDQRTGQKLPDDLQNIIMSCLRKDPEQRPVSAEELADALSQCRDAGRWTTADACQWWESVFDGPRDDLDDLDDNSRPGPGTDSPTGKVRSPRPGGDTKVDEFGDHANPNDKPSEKTVL